MDGVDFMCMLCGGDVDDVDFMCMLCGGDVDDVDFMCMLCGGDVDDVDPQCGVFTCPHLQIGRILVTLCLLSYL